MKGKRTTRRDFMKAMGLGAAALALPGCAGISGQLAGKTPKHKPNVLFIAIDDMNHWIGCMRGYPGLKTPNLDRLAQRGVLFTNAHCSAPSCNPCRASLLTGILPSTSGVYGNTQPWRKSPVLKDAVTLPRHFMDNGYLVAGAGKIFHVTREGYFTRQDWNEYKGIKQKIISQMRKDVTDASLPTAQSSASKANPNPAKPPEWPVKGMFWGPLDVPDEQMGDWQTTSWIIEQLDRKYDKPFFLACGISKPHLNWMVPRKYFDMHPVDKVALPEVKENDLDDIPETGKRLIFSHIHESIINSNNWRSAVQAYLACISFVDVCIGRLIDALDKSPYADNTVIVLWSDHGWHLGQKHHWKKFVLWEEATHVPFMITAPGITRPNEKCSRPVSFIDIYPTLIDLCGMPPKNELEGKSLLPLLKNTKASWDRPALTTINRGKGVCHSLRSERWRYIRYHDGSEELYDHYNDKQEWENLANDPRYEKVKKDLIRWLPKTSAPPSPRTKPKKKAKSTKK